MRQLERRRPQESNSLEEYNQQVAKLEENISQELAETRSVLEASPGGEIGTIPTSSDEEEPKYDQTKLDGISQLWGMPPGELSELQSYEEPSIPPGEDNFDGIAQLYGASLSSSSSRPAVGDDEVDSVSSFSGISMLWGDSATNDLDDSDLSSSATRSIRGGTRPIRTEDAETWAAAARPTGQEVRMSQILADEVWDEELENVEPPDYAEESYEDVVKFEAEMLEAEKEERLETEAILNAPAFAEYLAVDDNDDGSKPLGATNNTMDKDDELAILEMDLPDEEPSEEPDGIALEEGVAKADSTSTAPVVAVRTSPSQVYLTELSQNRSSSDDTTSEDDAQSPTTSGQSEKR